jgi:ABC-type lipopolysaccharide export system ATPase subunit
MRAEAFFTCSMSAESPDRNAASQVLRIKAVRKVYRDLEVIRNVSLNVAASEFVSILGRAAAAKPPCC